MDVMFFGEHLAFEFGGEVDIKTVGKIYPSDAWRGLISKSVGFLNTFCRHWLVKNRWSSRSRTMNKLLHGYNQ